MHRKGILDETRLLSHLKDKRNDIHILYNLFFERLADESERYFPTKIPDRFTLIEAFALLVGDVEAVRGYVNMYRTIDPILRLGRPVAIPHAWLTWKEERFIIDVIPTDGVLGISVPQVIIEQENFIS